MNSLIGTIITYFAVLDNSDYIGFTFMVNNYKTIKMHIPSPISFSYDNNHQDYQVASIAIKNDSFWRTRKIIDMTSNWSKYPPILLIDHFNENYDSDSTGDYVNKFITVYRQVEPGRNNYISNVPKLKRKLINAVI